MSALDLDARLDALYAGPPEEFVAARDALARDVAAAGDTVGSARIRKLRRPSVAGWAVNQVARTHAEEVGALAALGDELRAATADGDRGRIKALDRLRRERTEALLGPLRASGDIGGRPVSSGVIDRVGETLTAAVMDADAAVVVRAGRLGQALQHVGFGIVDEGGGEADVVTMRAETSTPTSVDDRDAADAAAEVARLEGLRGDADERARGAEDLATRQAAEVARLEAELDRLTKKLDAARQEAADARRAAEGARDELAALDAALDEARRRAAPRGARDRR